MLVRVSDAAVIFLFEFVLRAAGAGIAALPKSLDELLALVVGAQLPEGRPLFGGDDVRNLFVKPLLVRTLHLFPDGLLAALFFSAEFFLWGRRVNVNRRVDEGSNAQGPDAQREH